MKPDVLERAVVLVVDDHPETLQLLIDALEGAGVTVLVATDGARALDQVQHLAPDLILLDAVMPGMDGFETCRALKNGPAAEAPVIFMTGLEDTSDIVKGLEAGGIDYLTKPIAPDELLARMRVHLANARSARGAMAALNASGRTMLAVGAQGEIRWATPQAHQILARLSGASGAAALELPREVRSWLSPAAPERSTPATDGIVISAQKIRVRFRLLSRVNQNDMLLTVQRIDFDKVDPSWTTRLQERFGLTAREAEVLYWLARGKSNRDIADILGMSSRTVDKHLEHAYPKIGVESRAGAVAATMRLAEE